jgi:hypothetical protein
MIVRNAIVIRFNRIKKFDNSFLLVSPYVYVYYTFSSIIFSYTNPAFTRKKEN